MELILFYIIERKPRWSKLIYNQSKGSNSVISKINAKLEILAGRFKSITFDIGERIC